MDAVCSTGYLQQEVSDTTLHFVLDLAWFSVQVDINIGSNATKLQSSDPANYIARSLNCSAHFTHNAQKGICSPICEEWKELTQNQVVTFTVTILRSQMFCMFLEQLFPSSPATITKTCKTSTAGLYQANFYITIFETGL